MNIRLTKIDYGSRRILRRHKRRVITVLGNPKISNYKCTFFGDIEGDTELHEFTLFDYPEFKFQKITMYNCETLEDSMIDIIIKYKDVFFE